MSDRIAVVTGATGGVGRAVARELFQRGCDVALIARGSAGLEAVAEEGRQAGVRVLTLPLDVTDDAAVQAAADRVERELGPIDLWINNAFSTVFAPFAEITDDEFRRTTDVSYLGYVNGTRAALRVMTPRDRGVVVQVGSTLAYRGIPLQSAYCGAKHAIQGFTESVRCELLHERSAVRITMVQLPAVNTPQFTWVLSKLPKRPQPVPPIYQPEVAARAIVWAAEHDRREWWVGGITATTMVLNAVVPGLLDRYLARKGVDSQQTDEADPHDGPVNLWHEADGTRDFGAHGGFGDQSHTRSTQWWLSSHRNPLLALAAAGVASGIGLRRRQRP